MPLNDFQNFKTAFISGYIMIEESRFKWINYSNHLLNIKILVDYLSTMFFIIFFDETF